ncbi:hypothetical protein NLJ89_g994 [Agrocybe chaxingu]|uniref:Uncharacterized protein n=1 Tax=Agrocybe chaxingu TaxID=84603 RepID=A0A9W8TE77_9AGAR|nr:hypothetical protein NLJ89_g994 [Agrocybe chaxingu]
MRWSLVLLTCFILQFLGVALALPVSSEDGLVPRARVRSSKSAKASSSTYRKNALKSKTEYGVKKNKLVASKVPKARGAAALKALKKKDADHILEHQVLNKALKDQGKKFSDLKPHTQSKVKGAFNSHKNLAYVDKSINRSKAAVYKAALRGNKVQANKHRDEYIKKTFSHAQGTAKTIDKTLKADGHKPNVHSTLMGAAKKAGIRKRDFDEVSE